MSDYYKFLTSCATPTISYQQGKVYELSDETLINEFLNADYIELYDGTLDIVENGLYNVTNYDAANVNVAGGGTKLDTNPSFVNAYPVGQAGRYLLSELDLDGVDFSSIYSSVGLKALFTGYTALKKIKNFNIGTIKPSDLNTMFQMCISLEEVPEIDTSACNNFLGFCDRCANLKNVPVYQMNTVNTGGMKIQGMFVECPSLTNQSLQNIVESLTTIRTTYSGTKTLAYVGLSQQQAEYCATLENWSTLTGRGWTTGY